MAKSLIKRAFVALRNEGFTLTEVYDALLWFGDLYEFLSYEDAYQADGRKA